MEEAQLEALRHLAELAKEATLAGVWPRQL
jgi:hypothetical protein